MKRINKDITTVERGILLNGVNCQRTMGSGVAKAYYTKWFKVKSQYMKTLPQLGQIDPVHIKDDLWVFNCYTQKYYGYDGRRYADITSIKECLVKTIPLARAMDLPIYTPLIGAGLGGLTAEEVIAAIELVEEIYEYPITLCEI